MIFSKLLLAVSAALFVSVTANVANANETMTVPGIVQSSAISACSLLVDHDMATVTPVVSLAPEKAAAPAIVRFSFRTASGETVAMHDVKVPAALNAGAAKSLQAFPFPAVTAGTSVHCDVTPVMAETIVQN